MGFNSAELGVIVKQANKKIVLPSKISDIMNLFRWEKPSDVIDKLSKPDDSSKSVTSPLAISAIADTPERRPGEETVTFHFSIYSKLGWIAWKENESSLYW